MRPLQGRFHELGNGIRSHATRDIRLRYVTPAGVITYVNFTEAGYEVIVASPKGGAAPVDPRSLPEGPPEEESALLAILEESVPLSTVVDREVDGIFFAGGHGTMFDFPTDPLVQNIVSDALSGDHPLPLVCHGPAVLVGATTAEGTSPLEGRKVTGFTNEEEEAVNLVEEVPFLLETRLKKLLERIESN